MIAKAKRPEGIPEDFQELRVSNYQADTIVEVLSLCTGLDHAINSIKPQEITKKARAALSDLIAQSYGLMAYRRALAILKDEGIAKGEAAVADFAYRFDLPDESHDDLVIYYKFQS
jgi:hypothetical protein